MGGLVQGFGGGFEYVARERRRELLEEAEMRRLARQARPGRRLRERFAPALRLVAAWLRAVRPETVAPDDRHAVGEVPDFAYLTPEASEGAGTVVEFYLGESGCVVRKTDLGTGTSTDAYVSDGPVRR